MMRLKLLSTSILIVSALLLNGVRNAAAESPSQPNQRSQTKASAQQHDSVATPAPTIFNQATAAPASPDGAANVYKEYKQASPNGDFPSWLQAIGTIGLLIFAWCQMGLVRRTTKATETAAQATRDAVIATEKYVELTQQLTEATRQSAEFAKLALSVGRPYLTVTPTNVEPSGVGPRFAFVLRNDGNRPAIIKRIQVAMKWESLPACPTQERRLEVCSATSARRIHEYVLAPARDSREYAFWYEDSPPKLEMTELDDLLREIWSQRDKSGRELHLFGFIAYGDPAGSEYALEFCWNFTVFETLSTQFYLDIFLDQQTASPLPQNI
jgi:hypothetical protein